MIAGPRVDGGTQAPSHKPGREVLLRVHVASLRGEGPLLLFI